MKYPKPIMKKSELMKFGFPEEFLQRAYLQGGIAWRINPSVYNSPLLYDTEELEKYRLNQVKIDNSIYLRK